MYKCRNSINASNVDFSQIRKWKHLNNHDKPTCLHLNNQKCRTCHHLQNRKCQHVKLTTCSIRKVESAYQWRMQRCRFRLPFERRRSRAETHFQPSRASFIDRRLPLYIVAIPYSRNKLSAQGRAKTQIIRRFMDGQYKEKQGAYLNPK